MPRPLLAIALAILITAGARLAAEPLVQARVVSTDTIQETAATIISVRPSDVPRLIQQNKQPKLFYLYASWCAACRKAFPGVMQLLHSGELKGVEPLFLSLDHDYMAMSRYLLADGFVEEFTPYAVKISGVNNLPSTLQRSGMQFDGGIPYLAVLDANGAVLAEGKGDIDFLALSEVLREANGQSTGQPTR